MQKMEHKFVQAIYDAIESLNLQWDSLIVYAEVQQGSYLTEFYAKAAEGVYVKCFDLAGLQQDKVDEVLDEIGDQVMEVWQGLAAPDQWSNMTLSIQKDGTFQLDYDYTNLDEQAYEYHQDWKQKYLLTT